MATTSSSGTGKTTTISVPGVGTVNASTGKVVTPAKTTTTATKTTVVPQTVSPTKVPTTTPTTQTKSPTTVPTTNTPVQTKLPTTVPTVSKANNLIQVPGVGTVNKTSGVVVDNTVTVPGVGLVNKTTGAVLQPELTETPVKATTPAKKDTGVVSPFSIDKETGELTTTDGGFSSIYDYLNQLASQESAQGFDESQLLDQQASTEAVNAQQNAQQANIGLYAGTGIGQGVVEQYNIPIGAYSDTAYGAPDGTQSARFGVTSPLDTSGGTGTGSTNPAVLNAKTTASAANSANSASQSTNTQNAIATNVSSAIGSGASASDPNSIGSQGIALPGNTMFTSNVEQMLAPLLEKLSAMKFEYDPEEDPEYQRSAAILENSVTQAMVGRGMMYSSVHQSAMASKMLDLQVALRKQRYDEYLQDRSFMTDMIKMQLDVASTAFNQQMSLLQYKADREDAQWSRYMQSESMRLDQARYNASVQETDLTGQFQTAVLEYQQYNDNLQTMSKKWANAGSSGASKEVAAFFGVTQGLPYGNSISQMYLNEAYAKLDSLASSANYYGNTIETINYIKDFTTGKTTSTTAQTPSVSDMGKATMQAELADLMKYTDPNTVSNIIADYRYSADTYRTAMGDYYWTQFLKDAQSYLNSLE